MRALSLAGVLVLGVCALEVRAEGFGFVYVASNVGAASGGHAAVVADGTVYHMQNSRDGLLLLVREGWPSFHLKYSELDNRPLAVARVDAPLEVTERVERAFSKLYVEQELALAHRQSLRDDVAWLEAAARGQPAPALRGAGLLDPGRSGDPDAQTLRGSVLAQTGSDSLAALEASSERELARLAAAPERELAALRDALTLREAARALDRGYGLDTSALVELPGEVDRSVSAQERAGLEALAHSEEQGVIELVKSKRPDRGYALLLAQARYLAARRSLATGQLVLLDAFADLTSAASRPAESAMPDAVRDRNRADAARIFGQLRGDVIAGSQVDEANWNLIEEIAAIIARDGRADAGGELSALGLRKLPGRGRSLDAPPLAGDPAAALTLARDQLARYDASLHARWSYDLLHHNCITELARTADAAYPTPAETAAAFGALSSPDDETFGYIPWVFFDRVRERLRVTKVGYFPARRERELSKLLATSPGLETRARESISYASEIYTPLFRDGAFLLFTDDVFWRRPAYGALNFFFGLGYTGYGLAALPFDHGTRAKAGLSGMLWSFPELVFMNVRKGTFDWAD